jgi:hypothetical protein
MQQQNENNTINSEMNSPFKLLTSRPDIPIELERFEQCLNQWLKTHPIDETNEQGESLLYHVLRLLDAGIGMGIERNISCQKIALLLIEKGANVNFVCAVTGRTPLHLAVCSCLITEALLKKGANPDVLAPVKGDKGNETPLMNVFYELDAPKGVAELLIKYSKNINLANQLGETALHAAVRQAPLKIIELLVKKGADSTKKNVQGETPLMCGVGYLCATRSGVDDITDDDKKIFDCLMSSGELNTINSLNGNTVLHYAVQLFIKAIEIRRNEKHLVKKLKALEEFKNLSHLISQLVVKGARQDIKNKQGEDIFIYFGKYPELISLFSVSRKEDLAYSQEVIQSPTVKTCFTQSSPPNKPQQPLPPYHNEQSGGIKRGFNQISSPESPDINEDINSQFNQFACN